MSRPALILLLSFPRPSPAMLPPSSTASTVSVHAKVNAPSATVPCRGSHQGECGAAGKTKHQRQVALLTFVATTELAAACPRHLCGPSDHSANHAEVALIGPARGRHDLLIGWTTGWD